MRSAGDVWEKVKSLMHHKALKGVFVHIAPRREGLRGLAGIGVPLLRQQKGHVHVP